MIESVGPATLNKAMDSLRVGGTIVIFGATTGEEAQINLKTLYFGQFNILGTTIAVMRNLERCFNLSQTYQIEPVIDTRYTSLKTRFNAFRRYGGWNTVWKNRFTNRLMRYLLREYVFYILIMDFEFSSDLLNTNYFKIVPKEIDKCGIVWWKQKSIEPKCHVRLVTAASLFDGHDVSINIMRRILQASGVEVVHLGHNRSVEEVVNAAIPPHMQGIAMSSLQNGTKIILLSEQD